MLELINFIAAVCFATVAVMATFICVATVVGFMLGVLEGLAELIHDALGAFANLAAKAAGRIESFIKSFK